MRAGRWLVAVITTRCGRKHSPCGHALKAFVPRTNPMSLANNPCCARGRVATAHAWRPRSTASMSAEGGVAGGESWGGHELLNTVTTDWVDDHLGDPEVGGRSRDCHVSGARIFETRTNPPVFSLHSLFLRALWTRQESNLLAPSAVSIGRFESIHSDCTMMRANVQCPPHAHATPEHRLEATNDDYM